MFTLYQIRLHIFLRVKQEKLQKSLTSPSHRKLHPKYTPINNKNPVSLVAQGVYLVEMMGVEPMSEIRSNRLLRVQTVDELFPFPRSPLSGVGSGLQLLASSRFLRRPTRILHPLPRYLRPRRNRCIPVLDDPLEEVICNYTSSSSNFKSCDTS